MADHSKIEWTDATWNPIRGCTRVSEGCRNCYAERVAARFSGFGRPYEGLAVWHTVGGPECSSVKSKQLEPRWTGKVRLIKDLLDQPLHWRKPRKIFVNSMSDLFHEGLDRRTIAAIFGVMALAPQHTFQVLTKRPQRFTNFLEYLDVARCVSEAIVSFGIKPKRHNPTMAQAADTLPWPLPNVWLGISAEDQKTAEERIPLLLNTPAAVRWVSYEPALGPLDFTRINVGAEKVSVVSAPIFEDVLSGRWWDHLGFEQSACIDHPRMNHLDWVVCGGESGPGARPMHPDWARSARDQCQAAGVPFFFKQWGEWVSLSQMNKENIPQQPRAEMIFEADELAKPSSQARGRTPQQLVERVGKKRAGRLLDGREWSQFPAVVGAVSAPCKS